LSLWPVCLDFSVKFPWFWCASFPFVVFPLSSPTVSPFFYEVFVTSKNLLPLPLFSFEPPDFRASRFLFFSKSTVSSGFEYNLMFFYALVRCQPPSRSPVVFFFPLFSPHFVVPVACVPRARRQVFQQVFSDDF